MKRNHGGMNTFLTLEELPAPSDASILTALRSCRFHTPGHLRMTIGVYDGAGRIYRKIETDRFAEYLDVVSCLVNCGLRPAGQRFDAGCVATFIFRSSKDGELASLGVPQLLPFEMAMSITRPDLRLEATRDA